MNAQRGYIRVTLDKERSLRFDLNALALIEERFGVPITELETRLAKPSVRDIRTILWAGLVHEDQTLTEEQVGALVDIGSVEPITAAILDAFSASAGAGPPGKNARRPKRSTGGKPSGSPSARSV